MPEDFISYARKAAQKAGLDPDLFVRQIQQESGFNPNAQSPAGAQGIAQIVPRFHPGVNPSDPYASLDYAAQLDAANLKQYGNTRDMLVAYNAGPSKAGLSDEQLPDETRNYLSRILTGSSATASSPSPRPTSPSPAPQMQTASVLSSSPFASQLLRGGANPLAVALLGGLPQQQRGGGAPAPAAGSPSVAGGSSASIPAQPGKAQFVPTQDPNKAIEWGLSQKGKRYAGPVIGESDAARWGNPGWDCSSFVSAAYKQLGTNLIPFTDAMFEQTQAVGKDGPQQGDLVFTSGYEDGQKAKYKHVGIYMDGGQVLDASYGRGVSMHSLSDLPGQVTFRRP